MKEPTFAVIMPLYNKAPYVRKAIGSVVAQTCGDWELWVVDDGSTDGSAAAVGEFTDPRIHLHRQANGGVSAARNKGVALSAAPCICFLDADDWWEPTFLEEMAALIGRHPGAGIYATGYTIVDRRQHKTRPAPIGVPDGFADGEINYFLTYARTLCMPLWTGAVCLPRQVFEEVHGFRAGLRMAEDFDLWVRIALSHTVVLLNRPLSNYNQDVAPRLRAIGSLPPPVAQFAFHPEYADPYKQRSAEAKWLVEYVQIVCLRQYYLSHRYHSAAKQALATIDMQAHLGTPHTAYLRQPLWLGRAKMQLLNLKRWARRLSI